MTELFTDGQVEQLFWARPVSTTTLVAAFVGVLMLTSFFTVGGKDCRGGFVLFSRPLVSRR